MRMPCDELFADAIQYFFQRKPALFPANLRIKNKVQKQVAQLFPDSVPVLRINSTRQLIQLFNAERSQGMDGLLSVPGTFFPEVVHDMYKSQKSIRRFFFFHIKLH